MPKSYLLYPFTIVVFSMAIFLPMMGRGFIHDDFVHLCSVAYDPIWWGLTRANGGPFYTPIAWLTFKVDWILWGRMAFPLAAMNLLLHIVNTLLLYRLALRLWQSHLVAWWTAFGFALLFPANSWAVMWISTRAHLLTTVFYLAAMLATLWFTRTQNYRLSAILTITLFSALAIFSKESGVTIPVTIALLLLYERQRQQQWSISLISTIGLFVTLFVLLIVYALLRSQSGAVPLTISEGEGYTYLLSLRVLLDNFLRYGWRTFGLLAIVAAAIVLSKIICKHRVQLNLLTRNEILFSVMLFVITIAPFILLPIRSGIYTYLPGIAAALLLGATVRTLYGTTNIVSSRHNLIAKFPILLVVAIYVTFTVGHSLKWKRMAEVNTTVLNQIATQQVKAKRKSLFVLTYSQVDNTHRFPEGFASWGFPYALRLLYADQTLNGLIVKESEMYLRKHKRSEIHFAYTLDSNNRPRVIKTTTDFLLPQ
ncbi:MAG: hypothetical protein AB1489_35090 [Acidobacteriota bacterium]